MLPISAVEHQVALLKQKLAELKSARSIEELDIRWSEFLIMAERCFNKINLVCNAGHTKAWFGRLRHTQRIDELLTYIQHARHADEHGISRVTRKKVGSVSIGQKLKRFTAIHKNYVGHGRALMEIDYIEFNSDGIVVGPAIASNAEIKFTPQTIELLEVKNRGRSFFPPKAHLGQPIVDANPVTVAVLATSFIDSKVLELKSIIGSY